MTIATRLVALERGRRPSGGLPFRCWRLSDADIDQTARAWGTTPDRVVRRLTAIHDASERANAFFRVSAGRWRAQALRTALTAYLMRDEAGALDADAAEAILQAVADTVGPRRFVWDTAFG